MKFCPNCGSTDIQEAGSVFIEDGPYDGNAGYVNEGDFSRFGCNTCRLYFGEMPQPILCAACGEQADSDVSEQPELKTCQIQLTHKRHKRRLETICTN